MLVLLVKNMKWSNTMREEICVSSPAHMKRIFQNTESTDNFFFEDADGNRWGKTGDVGYIDEDGDVYILGRAADIFISIKGIRFIISILRQLFGKIAILRIVKW